MKILKYRPNFFSGFDDEVYEVNSKEELLTCGLVNSKTMKGFAGLSYTNYDTQGVLSCEFENGEHYVVAIVHDKESRDILSDWFDK